MEQQISDTAGLVFSHYLPGPILRYLQISQLCLGVEAPQPVSDRKDDVSSETSAQGSRKR